MKFYNSVRYAIMGIYSSIGKERNFTIQLLFAVAAIISSFFFHISKVELAIVIFCIGFVLSLELINTSIEKISDFICSEQHPKIKEIKDISAGAVLIAAACSTIIAAIIFLPKIIKELL